MQANRKEEKLVDYSKTAINNMEMLEFVTQHWAQITLLLGGLGYLVRAFFDYRLKRKEIMFSFVYKEKADGFKLFFLSLQEFHSRLVANAYRLKKELISYPELQNLLNESRTSIRTCIDNIYIFCSKREIELMYEISNSTAEVAYKVSQLKEDSLDEFILGLGDKNRRLVNKLISKL